MLLTENVLFELHESIKADLQCFTDAISGDLPGKELFKEMGFGSVAPEKILIQILNSFQLDGK